MRSAEDTIGSITDGGGPAAVRGRAGLGACHDILDRIVDGTASPVAGDSSAGSIGTALEVGDELLRRVRDAGSGAHILLQARALAHDTVLPVAHLSRLALIGAGAALRAEEYILDGVLDRGGGRLTIISAMQVGQELFDRFRGTFGSAKRLLYRIRRAKDTLGPIANFGRSALIGRGGVLSARHDVRKRILSGNANGAQEDEAR